LGIPKRFRVVIDAGGMAKHLKKERSTHIETLLSEHISA
jgi:hypothetical protein